MDYFIRKSSKEKHTSNLISKYEIRIIFLRLVFKWWFFMLVLKYLGTLLLLFDLLIIALIQSIFESPSKTDRVSAVHHIGMTGNFK